MHLPRSSGILLHPTSLPGEDGIGDLGPRAHEFVELLAGMGQRWWQVLPLGPTGGMNSPYQSNSSFAGNPLLVSLSDLVSRGWLGRADLRGRPRFPADRVDFTRVARFKTAMLQKAYAGFPRDDADFLAYCGRARRWLDDYALFVALKETRGGKAWTDWEPALAAREPAALRRAREELAERIRFHQFVQYAFQLQITALRRRCAEHDVKLIGDIPIFVAHDSADVWTFPGHFFLDEAGRPIVQAGVPPDLFCEDGQLWGNPLYRWKAHQEEGFSWWIRRLEALLDWVDLIRIDHFRGFEAYWEVPGQDRTARNGRWVKAPGGAFFTALKRHFGDLPLIAEDLGVITPPVEALRDRFKLPGMRVMQFGFSTSTSEEKYLPHRFIPNCIAYTGTHDNDTSVGWLRSTDVQTTQSKEQIRAERAFALRYVGSRGREFHWDLIRAVLASVADVAIIPMQDILGLDSSARMNTPGRAEGNWGWRFTPDQLTPEIRDRLARMTATYGRWNGTVPVAIDPRQLEPSGDGTAEGRTSAGPQRKALRGRRPARPKPEPAGVRGKPE
ncbi:MAG: 4-alpha-glucanotransferase [Isosphaeraceae bacterium]